jgi:excisionase family DNA binding protein
LPGVREKILLVDAHSRAGRAQRARIVDVLTAEQAARELGYHLNHLYRMLANGTIKGKKWANAWMIERSEVERIKAMQTEHGRLPKGAVSP